MRIINLHLLLRGGPTHLKVAVKILPLSREPFLINYITLMPNVDKMVRSRPFMTRSTTSLKLQRNLLALGDTLGAPVALALGPDGSLYVSDNGPDCRIKRFDADGKFVSASAWSVPADAGSVPVDFGDARKAYVMLFDDNFRPLCERCPYVTN